MVCARQGRKSRGIGRVFLQVSLYIVLYGNVTSVDCDVPSMFQQNINLLRNASFAYH